MSRTSLGARVPLLDLRALHAELQDDLDGAALRVLRSERVPLGPELSAFEQRWAAYVGAGHAVGVGSGLDALTLGLRALGVGPGDDCLFVREASDGTRYALVKRLVKLGTQGWTVKQYNPPRTYTLSRKEWQKAHLVIGKYNRGS